MSTHPELRVLAGPAEGDSLVLSESDRTYVLGSANADLVVRDIPVRLVFRRSSGPSRVTLTESDGAEATVNGQTARLPRDLEPGDVIRLPGLSPTLIEYRDPGASTGPATDELLSPLGVEDTNEMKAPSTEERVLDDDEPTSMVSRDTVNRILGLAGGDPEKIASEVKAEIKAAVHEDATLHLEDAEAFAAIAARVKELSPPAPAAPAPPPPSPATEPPPASASAPDDEVDPTDRTILAGEWPGVGAVSTPAAPAPPPDEPPGEDRTVLAADWREMVAAATSPPPAAAPPPAPRPPVAAAPPPAPPPTPPARADEPEGTVLGTNPLPQILASAATRPPSPDQTLLGDTGSMPTIPEPPRTPAASKPVVPAAVPTRTDAPAAGGSSFLVKALLGCTVLGLVVVVVAAVMILRGGSSGPAAPTPVATVAPTAGATPATPAGTPTTVIVDTAAPPPSATLPRILRVEPPSASPGASVTIEASDVPADARVYFGATLARVVSRDGDHIVAEVPDPGTPSSVGITLKAGDVSSLPFNFSIDAAPATALTFRYELKPGANAGADVATIYIGPVPLGIVVAKGGATSIEEKAKLVTLEMESAQVALSSNPKAFLRIQKGRAGWDIQVALPDAPALATPHSVTKDEVAYVTAQGSPVSAERLAGYWMGILHDVLTLSANRNDPLHLPDDSPGAPVLKKLLAGGIDKGFATLAPDERQTLELLAQRVPDAFANFAGTFRGTATVDRAAFKDITWPRAELTIDLKIDPIAALDATGQATIGWVTALDDSGVNKTHQKVGDFPIQGARLDPTNLNRMTFTIDRNGQSIPFTVTRKVDQVTKAPMVEGRYGGTTDFVLRRL